MPSIKDLKKRIGTVKNTQQTTKAMKMVSAAKLRRAQDAITNNRPYAKQISSLMEELASSGVKIQSPFVNGSESSDKPKRVMLVVVTSDRGLCAGFNSNIIKNVIRYLKEHREFCESITLSFVGKRGNDFFKTKMSGNVKYGTYFEQCGGKVTFAKAKILSEALCNAYLSGEFDEIKVIYNEFKNAVTQVVKIESFLPIQPLSSEASKMPEMVITKPSAEHLASELIKKHFPIHAMRILLESQAGEHGARMSAMENATKNASEMIKKLTIQYNKQRQAGITKELLEIIAGSESQKQA